MAVTSAFPECFDLADVGVPGVLLRRYEPGDTDRLHAAIEMSREHLRPYMFWADQSREATADHVRDSIASWDGGPDRSVVLVAVEDGTVLGGGGLHQRSTPDVREIGYWRRVDAGGRGVITALARVLTTAGLAQPGVERVEIHCDVTNTASAAVPRRLGYRFVEIVPRPQRAPAETGRQMIWATSVPPPPLLA